MQDELSVSERSALAEPTNKQDVRKRKLSAEETPAGDWAKEPDCKMIKLTTGGEGTRAEASDIPPKVNDVQTEVKDIQTEVSDIPDNASDIQTEADVIPAKVHEEKKYCWALYNAGCTFVMGIYSSKEKAVAAFKNGKCEHPEYNFNPADNDVFVYKVPMDELASIGFSGVETGAEIIDID
jgi:hypothetical protein